MLSLTIEDFKLGALLLIMLGVTTLRFFLCMLFDVLKLVMVALNLEKLSPFYYWPAPSNSLSDFQLISPFLVANLPILNISLIEDPCLM